MTTQESFPYNPGLPSVRDKEREGEKGEPSRKGRKERQEKQEKWNSWASSSGEIWQCGRRADSNIILGCVGSANVWCFLTLLIMKGL